MSDQPLKQCKKVFNFFAVRLTRLILCGIGYTLFEIFRMFERRIQSFLRPLIFNFFRGILSILTYDLIWFLCN